MHILTDKAYKAYKAMEVEFSKLQKLVKYKDEVIKKLEEKIVKLTPLRDSKGRFIKRQ